MASQTVRTTLPLIQELTGCSVPQPPVEAAIITERSTRSLKDNLPDDIETIRPKNKHSNDDLLLTGEKRTVDRDKHKRHISAVTSKKLTSDSNKRCPEYVLRRVKDETGATTAVRAEVLLPGLSSGAGVAVCVGEDRLVLDSAGYFLDLILPRATDADMSMAHFVVDKQVTT